MQILLTLTEATHRKEVLGWQLHQSQTACEEKEKSAQRIYQYITYTLYSMQHSILMSIHSPCWHKTHQF